MSSEREAGRRDVLGALTDLATDYLTDRNWRPDKAAQYREDVFANLVPDSAGVLQTAIECLVGAMYNDDTIADFATAFQLVTLDAGQVDGDELLAAVRKVTDKNVLLKMIARLSFEVASDRGADDKALLKLFKAGSQPPEI